MALTGRTLGLTCALICAPLTLAHAQVVAPAANPAAIEPPPPAPDPSKVATVNAAMAQAGAAAAAQTPGQGRGNRGAGGPGGPGGFGGRGAGGGFNRPASPIGAPGANAAPAPAAISLTNTPTFATPQAAAAPGPGGPGRGGRFAAGAAATPPAPPAPPEGIIVKTPSTPKIDPLAGLGGKVGAILDVTTKPHLLIVDDDHGVADTRDLSVGDEYKEGWRLVAVSGTSFTMRKGKDSRQIAVNLNNASRTPPQDPGAGLGGGGGRGGGGPGGPGGGRGGGFGFGNGAPGGRGAPGAAAPGANINSPQAQAMAAQMLANLPPEVMAAAANDPRGAAILSALQSGNIGDVQALVGQALGGQGGAAVFLARPAPQPAGQ